MDEVFLTTSEVIEYLQVNLRTVYRLLKSGDLPGVRVGRQWRFRKADVDAWLQTRGSRRETPTAGPAPTSAPSSASPHAAQLPTAERSHQATAAKPRILVADDEESIREMLAQTLMLADYVVETVPDGQAAIDCLRIQPFDLLITDLSMPRVDGLGLIREARRLQPQLPIIIITGFSTESTAIEAINLGVTGYLTKPFKLSKVLSVAARAIGEDA
jgi:excisionase family DNA binding protein